MIRRCEETTKQGYENYGGRGVKVCKRWRSSFADFFEDMGSRPSPKHSLDRYPDKDGDYEPGNCRWATAKEQCRNKRNNRIVTARGKSLTVVEWSEITGTPKQAIISRLNLGWNHEDAISLPTRNRLKPEHQRLITAYGKSLTAKAWSAITGIPTDTIFRRVYRNWDPEEAVSLPVFAAYRKNKGVSK